MGYINFLYFLSCTEPIYSVIKETLNKLIPLMVRQPHHERNQPNTVRPEPFDKLRRALSKDLFRDSFIKELGFFAKNTL